MTAHRSNEIGLPEGVEKHLYLRWVRRKHFSLPARLLWLAEFGDVDSGCLVASDIWCRRGFKIIDVPHLNLMLTFLHPKVQLSLSPALLDLELLLSLDLLEWYRLLVTKRVPYYDVPSW